MSLIPEHWLQLPETSTPLLSNRMLRTFADSISIASESVESRYQRDIIAFVTDILRANPTAYQQDILEAFRDHKRVSIRGPHGLGKTALASWCTLWLMTCHGDDVKVIMTASAWQQISHYLAPEIRKWALRADWSAFGIKMRYGKEVLDTMIKLPGQREAFGVASKNPQYIEGAHARTLGYIFDEAKAIPIPTWDAAEGAFSSAGDDTEYTAYALAISTPGDTSGRFYDIHKRRPGTQDWWVKHVTLDEAIAANRISREWADTRREQWGEHNPVYQQRVLGQFAEQGTDTLIPLSWIEAAKQRWLDCGGTGDGIRILGVDPARYGTDKTAFAHLCGHVLERMEYTTQQSTMQTVGKIVNEVSKNKSASIQVDVIGIGAGVVDRLKELGYAKTRGINVANSTKMKDDSRKLEFVNLRSALWWRLRDALDPEKDILLALPDDPLLEADLSAPTWKYTSSGKIQVESKDDIRKRIGRSTDGADALALAWHGVSRNYEIGIVTV